MPPIFEVHWTATLAEEASGQGLCAARGSFLHMRRRSESLWLGARFRDRGRRWESFGLLCRCGAVRVF